MYLGVDVNDIEAVSYSNVDDAFCEMLTAVLSKGITQRRLADAFMSPIVGYRIMAETVLQESFSNTIQGII